MANSKKSDLDLLVSNVKSYYINPEFTMYQSFCQPQTEFFPIIKVSPQFLMREFPLSNS